MRCDRCGESLGAPDAHIVGHLKVICEECYGDLLRSVVSVEEWLKGAKKTVVSRLTSRHDLRSSTT